MIVVVVFSVFVCY